MPIPLVDLKAQYRSIKQDIDAAVARVLENASYILGKEVETFEQAFAAYCGTTYAVGVSSGTDALHLALLACGVGPGDEVITTPFTFIATAAAISHVGATPVFVDIDERSYNMDPARIEAAITPRTKAILPVDLYGQPADMDPIMEIARRYDLRVIEDACQAVGARYRGRRAGSLGDAGCFSFYPAKNLGAAGDGGMLTTNNAEIAERVRNLRDHGRISKYSHGAIGYTYRLDGLQAAILGAKLGHLDGWNDARRAHAQTYNELLEGTGVILPQEAEGCRAIYHVYALRVPRRDELLEYLRAKEIGASIHYPLPVHLQPAYAALGIPKGSFPIAEACADSELSLPLYPEMTREQIEEVAAAVKEFLG
ncbi:MAG: DegT/DnrJ/EryC1/StrS family aminotransferase [Chloroflexi bacterium]|jgi:dTDP-4-amino-4,6-dideoxygalactose transaminase|nr:DegT/DnrJ/EryC1/StrS family aminotransferase [Chloroflexota bacterium]